jgi:hypothetical protein
VITDSVIFYLYDQTGCQLQINQSIQVGDLRIVIIWSLSGFHLKCNFVPNNIFSTKANSNKFYNFKCFRGISAGDNLLIAANCQLILMPSFTYRVEVLFSRCTLNLVNIIIRKRSFAFGRINLSSNNLGSILIKNYFFNDKKDSQTGNTYW